MSEFREVTWEIEQASTLNHFLRGEPITEDKWTRIPSYTIGGFPREENARRYLNEYLIPENFLRNLYRIRKVTTTKDTVWSMDPADLDDSGEPDIWGK